MEILLSFPRFATEGRQVRVSLVPAPKQAEEGSIANEGSGECRFLVGSCPQPPVPLGVAGALRTGAAVRFLLPSRLSAEEGPGQALGNTTQSHLIKRNF